MKYGEFDNPLKVKIISFCDAGPFLALIGHELFLGDVIGLTWSYTVSGKLTLSAQIFENIFLHLRLKS